MLDEAKQYYDVARTSLAPHELVKHIFYLMDSAKLDLSLLDSSGQLTNRDVEQYLSELSRSSASSTGPSKAAKLRICSKSPSISGL